MKKQDVVSLVESHGSWSMSDFQSRYFVVNSQVTTYRRVRQALLEIDTRIAAEKQIIRSTKRTKVEMQIKKRDLSAEPRELEKEIILLDIDQLQYDVSVYDKKLKVVKEEIELFSNLVIEMVPNVVELEKYKEHNDELEREYWITRMAKQASIDMVTTGRLGAGNLDSIAMMSPEDQASTIGTSLIYSQKLTSGISLIEDTVKSNPSLTESSFLGLFSEPIPPVQLEKTNGEKL